MWGSRTLRFAAAAGLMVSASVGWAAIGPPADGIELDPPPPAPVRSPDAGTDSGEAGVAGAPVPAAGEARPVPPVTSSPPPSPIEAPPLSTDASPPVSKGPPSNARMPVIQRPEQPIETTPLPGRVVPPAPSDKHVQQELKYVRGLRYILSGHRENYFISGVTGAQHLVKFQYSAKFDLWPNASRHSAYFGFTQKSIWDLWSFGQSSPFLESNYAPEIFYGYHAKIGDIVPLFDRNVGFIEDARIGLEHESNGVEGARSRSWNRIYATMRAGAYFGTNHYVTAAPRAWLPPFGVRDNPDIKAYLGLGSLTVEYGYDPVDKGWYGGGNIAATVWKGLHRDLARGAVEVALQWRPAYEGKFLEWWKFTPFFYLQVYRGYGETLLQYNQQVNVVRFGVSFEDRVNWITLPKNAATNDASAVRRDTN